jgi:hypothetical protein
LWRRRRDSQVGNGKIVPLGDYMQNRKRAAKSEADLKPRRSRAVKRTSTWIDTETHEKLRALSLQKKTDLSGAIEWLFDQLPEVRASIERFMAGK